MRLDANKISMLAICVVILLLPNQILHAQNFEGIIEYEMIYEIKNSNISKAYLEQMAGEKSTTYIKNGFYREDTDSKFMNFQLFRHDDNRIYFKHLNDKDTLRFATTIENKEKEFSYNVYKNADTILGVSCDKLIVKDENGTNSFYYSPIYSINPKYYENYTIYNKDKIVEIMKAIYLKLEMEDEDFKVVIEAKSIKREKLNKNIFKIPKHKILIEK